MYSHTPRPRTTRQRSASGPIPYTYRNLATPPPPVPPSYLDTDYNAHPDMQLVQSKQGYNGGKHRRNVSSYSAGSGGGSGGSYYDDSDSSGSYSHGSYAHGHGQYGVPLGTAANNTANANAYIPERHRAPYATSSTASNGGYASSVPSNAHGSYLHGPLHGHGHAHSNSNGSASASGRRMLSPSPAPSNRHSSASVAMHNHNANGNHNANTNANQMTRHRATSSLSRPPRVDDADEVYLSGGPSIGNMAAARQQASETGAPPMLLEPEAPDALERGRGLRRVSGSVAGGRMNTPASVPEDSWHGGGYGVGGYGY